MEYKFHPASKDKVEGLILGSLVGDALGVPVEFAPRVILKKDPVVDMRGFGVHNQPKGTWSDDGSLLLCSLETLVENQPSVEALKRFTKWLNEGYWAAHGTAFDIGNTTAEAIENFMQHGVPSAPAGHFNNGNGSLMRISPLALFIDRMHMFPEDLYELCKEWSSLTHGNEVSAFCCTFYVMMVSMLLEGKMDPLDAYIFTCRLAEKLVPKSVNLGPVGIERLISGTVHRLEESQIRSGGYCIDTLEASIWAALNSTSYSEGVLKAVNLGEDSDTTGTVCGGLLGAYYGRSTIPVDWINSLARINDIDALLQKIK